MSNTLVSLQIPLTFKFHIDELNKKVSRAVSILYKLRPFVTTKILSNVYYAIIYPFLLYGIVIWGNTSNNLLEPIHVLQKKCVCMATFDGYPIKPGPLTHTPPLFHKLRILTVYEIFKLQLGKLVYESNNNIGPSINVIKFTRASEIHSHNKICWSW